MQVWTKKAAPVSQIANLATTRVVRRPAVVPTRAEFCFGMKSGGASTPTVRPEGVSKSRHF
jgi:hypothetical protein